MKKFVLVSINHIDVPKLIAYSKSTGIDIEFKFNRFNNQL